MYDSAVVPLLRGGVEPESNDRPESSAPRLGLNGIRQLEEFHAAVATRPSTRNRMRLTPDGAMFGDSYNARLGISHPSWPYLESLRSELAPCGNGLPPRQP